MTETQPVMGVAEIAAFLNIRRPNVRKLLDRHEVQPIATLAVGPVYDRSSIADLKRKFDADEARAQTNEKRRAAARARGR